jgi:hypothetical protein
MYEEIDHPRPLVRRCCAGSDGGKRKRAVPSGEDASSPAPLRSGLAALTCRGRACCAAGAAGRGNHGSAAAHLLPPSTMMVSPGQAPSPR